MTAPLEMPEPEEICDGIHDEGAPAHYLCSRCFPELDHCIDLARVEDGDDAVDEYPSEQEEERD